MVTFTFSQNKIIALTFFLMMTWTAVSIVSSKQSYDPNDPSCVFRTEDCDCFLSKIHVFIPRCHVSVVQESDDEEFTTTRTIRSEIVKFGTDAETIKENCSKIKAKLNFAAQLVKSTTEEKTRASGLEFLKKPFIADFSQCECSLKAILPLIDRMKFYKQLYGTAYKGHYIVYWSVKVQEKQQFNKETCKTAMVPLLNELCKIRLKFLDEFK